MLFSLTIGKRLIQDHLFQFQLLILLSLTMLCNKKYAGMEYSGKYV